VIETLRLLVYFWAASFALIETIGRIPGFLPPLTRILGIIFFGFLIWGYRGLLRTLHKELLPGYWGAACFASLIFAVLTQVFWAFFRAPLDVDGLFYHLPLTLEALSRGHWGEWQLPVWQLRAMPKLGEIPVLLSVGLGGVGADSFGYRLSQMGQLYSLLMGSIASYVLTQSTQKNLGWVGALVFLSTPLAIKQATSHYVDISAWALWLAAFALIKNARLAGWIALALHTGVKVSGALTALPLLIFGILKLRHENATRSQSSRALFTLAVSGLAVAASWMVPNYQSFNNPTFPVDPLCALKGGSLVPKEAGVATDYQPLECTRALPKPLAWPLHWITPLLPFTYDMGAGAWGLLPFALVIGFLILLLTRSTVDRTGLAWLLWPAIAFVLMPGREVPRHGFLGGFTLCVGLALLLLSSGRAWARPLVLIVISAQFLISAVDRAQLRGISASLPPSLALQMVLENTRDLVLTGEPQGQERWIHAPYVRELRAQSQSAQVIELKERDLHGVFWGRKFDNTVTLAPSYCRWPYCPDSQAACSSL
jgi:hypothetical protein